MPGKADGSKDGSNKYDKETQVQQGEGGLKLFDDDVEKSGIGSCNDGMVCKENGSKGEGGSMMRTMTVLVGHTTEKAA